MARGSGKRPRSAKPPANASAPAASAASPSTPARPPKRARADRAALRARLARAEGADDAPAAPGLASASADVALPTPASAGDAEPGPSPAEAEAAALRRELVDARKEIARLRAAQESAKEMIACTIRAVMRQATANVDARAARRMRERHGGAMQEIADLSDMLDAIGPRLERGRSAGANVPGSPRARRSGVPVSGHVPVQPPEDPSLELSSGVARGHFPPPVGAMERREARGSITPPPPDGPVDPRTVTRAANGNRVDRYGRPVARRSGAPVGRRGDGNRTARRSSLPLDQPVDRGVARRSGELSDRPGGRGIARRSGRPLDEPVGRGMARRNGQPLDEPVDRGLARWSGAPPGSPSERLTDRILPGSNGVAVTQSVGSTRPPRTQAMTRVARRAFVELSASESSERPLALESRNSEESRERASAREASSSESTERPTVQQSDEHSDSPEPAVMPRRLRRSRPMPIQVSNSESSETPTTQATGDGTPLCSNVVVSDELPGSGSEDDDSLVGWPRSTASSVPEPIPPPVDDAESWLREHQRIQGMAEGNGEGSGEREGGRPCRGGGGRSGAPDRRRSRDRGRNRR